MPGLKSRLLALVFVAGAASVWMSASQAAAADRSRYHDRGAHEFSVHYETWTDPRRDRDLPVKIYAPQGADAPPVVVFSHGLGGSVEAAGYLGEHLASWGFLALHVQHPGSDRAVWAGADSRPEILARLREAVRDPGVTINRFRDLPFLLDEIETRVRDGRLDANPRHIGMAGHSFGSHSVLAAAGRAYPAPRGTLRFADPRIDAGVLLSPPPGNRIASEDYDAVFGQVAIPLLHVTGRADGSPLDPEVSPQDRLVPFRQIPAAPQILVLFDQADHRVFSGRRVPRAPAWYAQVQADVAACATAFFLDHLRDDREAAAFMGGSDLDAALIAPATVSRRNLPATPEAPTAATTSGSAAIECLERGSGKRMPGCGTTPARAAGPRRGAGRAPDDGGPGAAARADGTGAR